MMDVKVRTEERKRRWEELMDLADQNNVERFWQRYADYLEWDNIVSPSRLAMHKMARLTAQGA